MSTMDMLVVAMYNLYGKSKEFEQKKEDKGNFLTDFEWKRPICLAGLLIMPNL